MRFKFRVWNNRKNEYEDDLYDEAGDLQITCVNKIFEEYISDGCIIEQCTGLKDKNGKLIYEGDLIKIDGDVAVIKWSDYYARFMLESSEDNFDFETTYAEECKVIGNIHENADLLENEK